MVKENSAMLMEESMMETGHSEQWKDMVNFTTQMKNLLMKVNGKTMLSMVKEKSIMKNLVNLEDPLITKILITWLNIGNIMKESSLMIVNKELVLYC